MREATALEIAKVLAGEVDGDELSADIWNRSDTTTQVLAYGLAGVIRALNDLAGQVSAL